MRKYAYSASLVAEELLLGALLFIPRPLNRPVVGMLMLDCEVCSRGVLLLISERSRADDDRHVGGTTGPLSRSTLSSVFFHRSRCVRREN